MQSIKDAQGRQWMIKVTVGSIQKCKALTGVDLFQLIQRKQNEFDLSLYEQLCIDGVMLCRCAWACSDAVDKISETDFLDAIGPNELPEIRNALLGDAVDFFPLGQLIKRVMERQREKEKEAKQAINNVTAETIDRALSTAKNSVTNGPESLA